LESVEEVFVSLGFWFNKEQRDLAYNNYKVKDHYRLYKGEFRKFDIYTYSLGIKQLIKEGKKWNKKTDYIK